MTMAVKERELLEDKEKESLIKDYQKRIEAGRSAERLSINSDWLKIKEEIERAIKSKEETKILLYDSILRRAITSDEKLKALDEINLLNSELENFKYFISMISKKVEDGQWAEKELEKLK